MNEYECMDVKGWMYGVNGWIDEWMDGCEWMD